MRGKERDLARVWDMVQAGRAAREFVAGIDFRAFLKDQKLRFAVERATEIIGEAARDLSPAFRARHPDIPWRAIIAQRNILTHRYWEVDPELLWQVATRHIPDLLRRLEPLVPRSPEEE